MAVGRIKRIKEIIERSKPADNFGCERIKEIIEAGIPTKDHGHIGISNEAAAEIKKICEKSFSHNVELNSEDAEEIRQLCEKEISIQDRTEYHKTYYIKNPDKYNQKGKKDAENSEV